MTDRDAADGRRIRLPFEAMASRNEIVLDGFEPGRAGADARAAARQAAHEAIAEVRRIEAAYSRYRPDSLLSTINAAAGARTAVAVDEETAGLLDFAQQLHALSGGRFDVTTGPLRRAWDFRRGVVPTDAELAPLLALVGWAKVEWDGRRVRLTRPGMELDFGGIGKEYASDRAHAVLARAGLRHGFVDLGGDLRLLGPRADGRPWSIGIQHPRRPDRTCAHLLLSTGALATSGDYERFFITPEGRRCCHLLDARTGQPVEHWQSVSVVSPTCAASGALASIAMLSGDDALDFLHGQRTAFLAVDAAGRVIPHDIDAGDDIVAIASTA